MSSQSGGFCTSSHQHLINPFRRDMMRPTAKRPKLGFTLPAKILSAVLFPIPFVLHAQGQPSSSQSPLRSAPHPTSPNTWPGRGTGNRCNLKAFAPYRCVTSFSRLVGRFTMWIASKGHFLTQIPHPMQSSSERKAILEVGSTSMQSFPGLTSRSW
ncbi:hypothetical protein BC830DRAFT_56604 [Chytriomyces sp. MP71]|nr:hypothetical protein BC830DRAFT_56604 [Chytriomyces sp. MP71]